jgi:hypothetical protein
MIMYTGKTIMQLAHERGSSAKTKSGAWKYLLAHLPGPDKTRCSATWEHEMWVDNRWHRRAEGRAHILGYRRDDPNTPGRVAERQAEFDRLAEIDRTLQVVRDSYGRLVLCCLAPRSEEPRPEIARYRAAVALVAQAAAAGIISRAHDAISWDHRGRAEGTALHHDLYDAAPGAAIVCLRRTIGTKYGVSTQSKTYVLLVAGEEDEIAARTLTIAIARYAKRAAQLGDTIAHVRGERKISLAPPPCRGYKALAIGTDGDYRSVWDGSVWPIGEPRIERARRDHDGGLYYYRDLDQLIAAARREEIFGKARDHHRLAIVSVIAEGRQIDYDGGKYAASRITITEQIGSLR